MAAANHNFSYIAIDQEIEKMMRRKAIKQTRYDTPNHGMFIEDADWALLNALVRRTLGETHMPRSLSEGNLVLAKSDRDLMLYLTRYAEKQKGLEPKELDGINSTSLPYDRDLAYNKIFAGMLSDRIKEIPENKTCIMPVNISSAESIEQGQAHVISMSFRRENNRIFISIYESLPVDEETRVAQAALIGQILQSILPDYQIIANGMPCGPQDGADCSLHAVFNSVLIERQCNRTLTFAECTGLRKALDTVNGDPSKLAILEDVISNILRNRNLLQAHAAAAAQPAAFFSSSVSASSKSSVKSTLTDKDYVDLQELYEKAIQKILSVAGVSNSEKCKALKNLYSAQNADYHEDLQLVVAEAKSLIGDQIDLMQNKAENNRQELSAINAAISTNNQDVEVIISSLGSVPGNKK